MDSYYPSIYQHIILRKNPHFEFPFWLYYTYFEKDYYHVLHEFPLWSQVYLKPEKEKSLALPKPTKDSDFYDDGIKDPKKVALGKLLFFDKILSGNQNISCATCHHPLTHTGDGLSLPIGEGGRGLGVTRDTGHEDDPVVMRVPRNAPPLFNFGAKEFVRMFYDGRIEVDPFQPSGFSSPAGDVLPLGLDNILAVQAMFPVTSQIEMAGKSGENSIADAAAAGDFNSIWEQLAQRLREIPEYVTLFEQVYPDVHSKKDITFVHVANAIAAFEAVTWRTDNAPFDRFLKGEKDAMSNKAKSGMKLFYGKAKCATCHKGICQTDHEFHAIAMPQIGPGKGDGPDGHEDYGRERVSSDQADRYKFLTPTLRNVVLTAPYGHDGAYNTLEAVIRHHLNPIFSLNHYERSQAILPSSPALNPLDFVVHDDLSRRDAIALANEIEPVYLTDNEIDNLIAFLHSLTDPASLDLRKDVPKSVPSQIPLFE
jgi:cytochrome c peroxidase